MTQEVLGLFPWLRSLLRPSTLATLFFFLNVSTGFAQNVSPLSVAELNAKFAPMELLFCFQGKGSCLPYDAGTLHEAYARIPAIRQGHTIVAGNSSGAIPAAYFGCFGFSDATVSHAESRLKYGNREAIRNMENVSNKISKIVQGKPLEIPHTDLREYVAFALGVHAWQDARTIEEIVRRSSAKPNFPCLIVACNKEILEDRHPESASTPGRLKEIDLSNMQVSWKPEVFDYYQQHPDKFRHDHPHLILGKNRHIGRAITFFVDRSMYSLLSQIPASERTADLRLMTDAADVALAILASTSEPTYFAPVVDPHPERVLVDERHNLLNSVRQRTYNGGYIISMPAQDVRRMLPGIRVLGTGWSHNPLIARTLLKNMLLADCEEIAMRSEWWADLEVNPDQEFAQHVELKDLTGEQEFQFGLRRARELFDSHQGLPAYVRLPTFRSPAAAAIAPLKPTNDMFAEVTNSSDQPILKTMRGIGPIIQHSLEQP